MNHVLILLYVHIVGTYDVAKEKKNEKEAKTKKLKELEEARKKKSKSPSSTVLLAHL